MLDAAGEVAGELDRWDIEVGLHEPEVVCLPLLHGIYSQHRKHQGRNLRTGVGFEHFNETTQQSQP